MIRHYIKCFISDVMPLVGIVVIAKCVNMFFIFYLLKDRNISYLGLWDWYQLIISLTALFIAAPANAIIARFFRLYSDSSQVVFLHAWYIALFHLLLLMIGFFSLIAFRVIPANFFSCFIFLIAILTAFVSIATACARGLQKNFLVHIIIAIQQLGIVFGYAFVHLYNNSLSALFCAQFLLHAVLAVFLFHYIPRHTPIEYDEFKKHFQYAVPLAFNSVFFAFFFSYDRIIIFFLHGASMLGAYGILARLGLLFQLCSSGMAEVWPFFLGKILNYSDAPENIYRIILIYTALLTFGASVALAVSICAVAYFFQASFQLLGMLLPLFFTQLLFIEFPRIAQTEGLIACDTKKLSYTSFFVMPLQIFLLIFFVARFNLAGACFANIVTFIVHLFVTLFFNQQKNFMLVISSPLIFLVCMWSFFITVVMLGLTYGNPLLIASLIPFVWGALLYGIQPRHEKTLIAAYVKNFFYYYIKRFIIAS